MNLMRRSFAQAVSVGVRSASVLLDVREDRHV